MILRSLTTGGRRRVMITAVLAASLTLVSACSSSKNDNKSSGGPASGGASSSLPLVKNGTLTVAAYGSNGKEVILNPDGSLGGFIGEVLNGFAKSRGLTLKTFSAGFASALLAVQQRKADLMYDVFYTDARAKTVHYSNTFFNSPVQAFTKKGFNYTDVNSLKGKKVATVTGLVWTPYIQKAFGSNALIFPSTTAAAQALVNGQADAYINGISQLSTPPLSQHSDEFTNHDIKAGEVGFPKAIINNNSYMVFSCEGASLADAYNSYVQTLVSGSQWTQMYDKAGILESQRVTPAAPPSTGC